MRHFIAFGTALAFAVGCGGDFSTSQDRSGVQGTGASSPAGGASMGGQPAAGGANATGGAPGVGGGSACTTDNECPSSTAPCRLCPDGTEACPWSKCENGQCVAGIGTCGPSGGGGVPASGGLSGSGGYGTGGAPGAQCKTNADCPQLGCFMCPASSCMNGQCVSSGWPGSGGVSGTGGSASGGSSGSSGAGGTGGVSGTLKWYATCGPPVCHVPVPGSGGTSSGLPPCTTTEVAGADCSNAGAECDTGAACSGPLMCTTSDPTTLGCPKSRAQYKTDVEYLSTAECEKLADDLQSIPLVRYRYEDGPEREHLGFIIEDVEPSLSVDAKNDRVDLYGYTSMAVAAIQEQHREIEVLKREIEELRSALARRPSTARRAR